MKDDMIFPAQCYCGSKSSDHRYGESRYICASCKRPLWQPIETAPKDDTEVLVLVEDGGILIGCFAGGMWWIEQTFYEKRNPTHWMPLPEPPRHE
jgi:hypothetical protein